MRGVRAVLTMMGLGCVRASELWSSDKEATLASLVTQLEAVMETPWQSVTAVSEMFATGAVANFSLDVRRSDLLRSSMYAQIRSLSEEPSVYMIYVGLESDGSFMGYYGRGQSSRGDAYYFTLLPGWLCDASSEEECRRYYDVDQTNGLPECGGRRQLSSNSNNRRSGSACSFPDYHDYYYASRSYDPRARSWYGEGEASSSDRSWSTPYVFVSDQVVGLSAMEKIYDARPRGPAPRSFARSSRGRGRRRP